jgi:hypothetical protein
MANGKSSSERISKIQDMFGLEKGEELIEKEQSCILCLSLAEEVWAEMEVRKASKCLNIIFDPKVLEQQQLDQNSFTIVLASSEDKSIVEEPEEFSATSIASFESLPCTGEVF